MCILYLGGERAEVMICKLWKTEWRQEEIKKLHGKSV